MSAHDILMSAAGGTSLAANYIEDIFSTYLYTGNGATQTITNGIDLSGKGGLTWIKGRTQAFNHTLVDTVRGATNLLVSNTTAAQATQANSLTAFTSTGFSIGAGSIVNYSGDNFASWTFRKQPKFFDIVTYTGTGVAGLNINHNLGSAPGCMFVKRTDATGAWHVFHTSLGGTKTLFLNATNAALTNIRYWDDTAPTSTVFTLGYDTDVNASGGTYVAYLFAHNAGGFGLTGTDNVISCGTFTTDVSANATVTLGYEPQFVIFKRTDSATNGDWVMFDNMRGMPATGSGSTAARLKPNTTDAENPNTGDIKITSTGFVVSYVPSATFIYIAIRRGPMRVPTDATKVFEALTYAGDGSTTTGQNVNTSFPMDFAFTRYNRSGAGDWDAISRLQGLSTSASNSRYLNPHNTNAEATGGYLWQVSQLQLKIYGFSGSTTQLNYLYRRAPGFFDVVCYTYTSGSVVISHNLGVTPELVILKGRSSAQNWNVYSQALGFSQRLNLNATDAVIAASAISAATSTTFTTTFPGSGGATVVAYLFATVAGVSKVGSYTGTGTTLQINCGFTGGSRFVLIKRTDSTGDWYVWDSARGIVAGNDPYLLLNSTAAEVTGTDYIDPVSSGFEISSSAPAAINASGGSYIYLAIA